MKIIVNPTSKSLGKESAQQVAQVIKDAIADHGSARIVLSTGASQLPMFDEIVKMDLPWDKVEMFHLDEYVDLPITHGASFRKYLTERFINRVHPGKVHLVDGTPEGIAQLTRELRSAPIDLGVIGIGENGHIAFNDPPADFNTREAYIVVNLNDTCKRQQVGEGWFATVDDVPKQAVSMTVWQIMQCKTIISIVPYAVKANAVANTLAQEANNLVPATVMKGHKDFTLYVDADSYAKVGDISMPEGTPFQLIRR